MDAKRGGARANAGQKMVTGTGKAMRKQVTLDETTVEVLDEVGEGNVSEGIRRLAYNYRENNPK